MTKIDGLANIYFYGGIILLSNTGTTSLDDFVYEISKRIVLSTKNDTQ